METIPKDLFNEILNRLSVTQLISLCKSNVQFNKLCTDDHFWQLRLQRDYPNINLSDFNIALNNPKEIYLALYKIRVQLIPIYYNDQYHMDLWISNNDNYQTILHRLLRTDLRGVLDKYDNNAMFFGSLSVIEFKDKDNNILISGSKSNMMCQFVSSNAISSIWIYDTPEKLAEQRDRLLARAMHTAHTGVLHHRITRAMDTLRI